MSGSIPPKLPGSTPPPSPERSTAFPSRNSSQLGGRNVDPQPSKLSVPESTTPGGPSSAASAAGAKSLKERAISTQRAPSQETPGRAETPPRSGEQREGHVFPDTVSAEPPPHGSTSHARERERLPDEPVLLAKNFVSRVSADPMHGRPTPGGPSTSHVTPGGPDSVTPGGPSTPDGYAIASGSGAIRRSEMRATRPAEWQSLSRDFDQMDKLVVATLMEMVAALEKAEGEEEPAKPADFEHFHATEAYKETTLDSALRAGRNPLEVLKDHLLSYVQATMIGVDPNSVGLSEEQLQIHDDNIKQIREVLDHYIAEKSKQR